MILEIKKSKTELEQLNTSLHHKVQEKTKAQNILLSLFDKGDAVLFKWKNDEEWSVEYVSLSVMKLLGYSKSDFTDNKITFPSCIHSSDFPKVMEEVATHSKGDNTYFKHEPYRLHTKDNQTKWVLDYTVILRDDNGDITHYLGYITDITEQKEQERLLYEKSKLASLGEMIGNIAHQWRQPLSVITTLASGSKMKKEVGILDDRDLMDTFDHIESNANYLSETIEIFRNYIKEEKLFKEVDIKKQIDETLKIDEKMLNDNNIQLINNTDSIEQITIITDEGELSGYYKHNQ
jgi:PAS domain S-box-containing protein